MPIYNDGLGSHLIKYELVGSRITCDPPVVGTDQDILVLVDEVPISDLESEGWVMGVGSKIKYRHKSGEYAFTSFKKGDLNYIVTTSESFFSDFMICTKLAKKFNLLNKEDRVLLFDTFMEKVNAN